MIYPFDKPFTVEYHPQVNGEGVDYLGSQTPSIYLFSTLPSRQVAAAGTGAVQTVSSWDEVDAKTVRISIAQVADPYPNDAIQTRNYYIAINFKLDSTGATVTDILGIQMSRARGALTAINVTQQTLEALYQNVSVYFEEPQILDAIELAIKKVKRQAKKSGIDWNTVTDFSELNEAVALKALILLFRSQLQRGNGSDFIDVYKEFKEDYSDVFEDISLELDEDGDGIPDQTAKAKKPFITMLR